MERLDELFVLGLEGLARRHDGRLGVGEREARVRRGVGVLQLVELLDEASEEVVFGVDDALAVPGGE